MDPATRRLLEGPIAPTLLRLAAPNVVMLLAQVSISILEAYYVGWLGADALAGVSVTFPLVMLMQTMSAGGTGRQGRGGAPRGRAGAGGRPPRGRQPSGDARDRDRAGHGRPLHRGRARRRRPGVPRDGRGRRR